MQFLKQIMAFKLEQIHTGYIGFCEFLGPVTKQSQKERNKKSNVNRNSKKIPGAFGDGKTNQKCKKITEFDSHGI